MPQGSISSWTPKYITFQKLQNFYFKKTLSDGLLFLMKVKYEIGSLYCPIHTHIHIWSTHSYVHTYIYKYIYTHIRTHIHVHTYLYTHMYSHIHVQTHLYTYTHMHMYTYIHTYIDAYIHTCMYIHTYMQAYTHIYIYTNIYTHIHIYTDMHVYTYIYTHTHKHKLWWRSWRNRYRRKWNWWPGFKSWTRVFAFDIELIPCRGKI